MLKVEYDYIVASLPDPARRKPTREEWLNLCLDGIKNGKILFDQDFEVSKFFAAHTAQVISLEHLLNNKLNPSSLIYITEGEWLDELYIYIMNELFSTETFIYNTSELQNDVYIYNISEYESEQTDYFINCPADLASKEDELRYYVGLYNLAGKTYKINYL